jgi:tRNA-splicing ligase RtcB (3'-phosphate/5'-hydroxy nucleic acid ligase)
MLSALLFSSMLISCGDGTVYKEGFIVISGKILKLWGWPEGKIMGLAKQIANAMEDDGIERDVIQARLERVREDPGTYLADADLAALAREVIRRRTVPPEVDTLLDAPQPFAVWGADLIDAEARAQMERALRLPVARAGALMPDAHIGYGLPIGGVLATDDAVIPYAVGVDIACRMRLSIFPQSPVVLGQRTAQFRKALLDETRFGMNGKWGQYDRPSHDVLDDPAWEAMPFLRSLKQKASYQLATSGSGNHFVEWGAFALYEDDAQLGLLAGRYLALLSHSGSRGVGFAIANRYTEIAREIHPGLDPSVQYLAWLSLASEAGQEYWMAMQLAGRFAAANHEVMHRRVAAAAGVQARAVVENHHNFAWEETLADGTPVIVHRKGATPAGAGVMGIIPGSMGDAGYVVRGKGKPEALQSAAHGAGRAVSRRKAFETITRTLRDDYLRERNVTLLGGAVDESPQAYKDIEAVISAQDDLVEIVGKFTPRIVRMAEEAGEY